MVQSIVPGDEINIKVKNAITVDAVQTIGENTYNKIAIIELDSDYNGAVFSTQQHITNSIAAENYYGLYLVPYNDNDVSNITLVIAVKIGEKTYIPRGMLALSTLLTEGTNITFVYFEPIGPEPPLP